MAAQVYWVNASHTKPANRYVKYILTNLMDPTTGSWIERIGANLTANLRALGVSGVAFIITSLGIVHYWDRLVWPLILPILFGWMSWSVLAVQLSIPAKLSRECALKAERFEGFAKQTLFLPLVLLAVGFPHIRCSGELLFHWPDYRGREHT